MKRAESDRPQHEPHPAALGLRWALVLFVVAATFRVGFIASRGAAASLEFPDEIAYWTMAESLARGDGLVGEHGHRAVRMPLYPAFLSVFASAAAARIAQALFGACAAVAIGLLGVRVGGRAVGIAAGLAVAVDPFLVFFSRLLLTETLFISALCATWYALARVGEWATDQTDRWSENPFSDPLPQESFPARAWTSTLPTEGERIPRHEERERILVPAAMPAVQARAGSWLGCGALLALCVYLRPSAAGLVLAVALLVVLGAWRSRGAWVGAVAMLAVVVVALLPWGWRNQRVTGEWVWLTNRTGISLWDGLGPQADGSSNLAGTKTMPAVQGLGEGDWNRHFRAEAIRSAVADPIRVLRLAGVKIRRTWSLVPNVESYQSPLIRFVSVAWTLPVYGFAVVGVWFLRKTPWTVALLLLPAGYFTLLHAVFVGSLRYRLPAMPLLEVLAAVGLVGIVTALRNRARAGQTTSND